MRSVQARKLSDYPGVSRAHLEAATLLSNPLLFGPPICDELIALVEHMCSEEEAAILAHITLPRGRTAAAVAAAVHRPLEEVAPVLEHLAHEKHVLLTSGSGSTKRYHLMPIVPGIFEAVLVRTSTETLTDWHRRFAELFEALYDTGFVTDYLHHPVPVVRYVPVQQTIHNNALALPSDKLEAVLDRYTSFGVGLCQCRLTTEITGSGCGKSLEVCVGFGPLVEKLIRSGQMRRTEKQEVLEIKASAEAEGLVNFVCEAELQQGASGVSCSCCGDCCHILRTISDFNMPGLVAPPHFRPAIDVQQCIHCGRCARACPMGAIAVDPKGKTLEYFAERCIGCGLCATACDKKHAITMEPVAHYTEVPTRPLAALRKLVPNYLRNVWTAWRSR
jgi:Pyruvate/2-oxoacid:ferredoxin oxidoreductase delta subunit